MSSKRGPGSITQSALGLGDDYDDRDGSNRVVYSWEKEADATWEAVQEDAQGQLILSSTISTDRERLRRAKLNRVTRTIRRGLIRFVNVAIDCSSFALEFDFRPSRIQVTKDAVRKFIANYFDQNPISQLGVSVTHDQLAYKLSDLSGSPKAHQARVQQLRHCAGNASLQNTLLLAISMLRNVPEYGNKELLIVYNSLSTTDPGDIFSTIRDAVQLKIRISVICVAAELYICKKMADMTGGTCSVAMDPAHLSELLMAHTVPPPDLRSTTQHVTDFVYVGLPKRTFHEHRLNVWTKDGKVLTQASSFVCPRCYARVVDLPAECAVCGLQLNSSANIARSYHHLFPVGNFTECYAKPQLLLASPSTSTGVDPPNILLPCQFIHAENAVEESSGHTITEYIVDNCAGCLVPFDSKSASLGLTCPSCRSVFCIDCDMFIHESLHNCPCCPL